MIALRSTSALPGWQKMAWPLVRLVVPRGPRWFYEGHPKLDGQLWYAERRLLYETVRSSEPIDCFEIGTWKGGGSTLFIAQALFENRAGVLHTIEIDPGLAESARSSYRKYLPHLGSYVDFCAGDYRQEYARVFAMRPGVDLLFLDGAENAEQTLAQYQFFEPHLHAGSVLLAHDWFTEKARLVREVIEQSPAWRIEHVLTPPHSVGFALATRQA